MKMAIEFDEREMTMISNAGFRKAEMKSATVTAHFFNRPMSLHYLMPNAVSVCAPNISQIAIRHILFGIFPSTDIMKWIKSRTLTIIASGEFE